MKKNILLAAIGLAVSGAALADAKSFEGFNAGANLKLVNASMNLSANGVDAPGQEFDIGKQSTIGSLQAGYTTALNDKFVLGVSAVVDLGDTKFGSVQGVSFKGKNAYAINFEPGYAVSKNTLLYGIVSYNSIKGEISGDTGGGPNTSPKFNGVGYGAGARVKLDNNLYVQIEATTVDYNDKTETQGTSSLSFKPRSTVGSIGIGYKF